MHANPFDSVNIFLDTRCAKALGMHWGTVGLFSFHLYQHFTSSSSPLFVLCSQYRIRCALPLCSFVFFPTLHNCIPSAAKVPFSLPNLISCSPPPCLCLSLTFYTPLGGQPTYKVGSHGRRRARAAAAAAPSAGAEGAARIGRV